MRLVSCTVDLARRRVVRAEGTAELTAREADLLEYLSKRPSRTISREELLSEVWGYADTVVSRACDNTIRRLREKIEADASRPDHVLTVHGTGYRFEPGAAAAPAPVPSPAPPPGAPQPAPAARAAPGQLFGRQALIREAQEMGADLLVLVGPAGVGKSRVAREIDPGALCVDLAGEGARSAAARVARALGIDPGALDPISAVRLRLQEQPQSLLLDNLDDLGPEAAALCERWEMPGVRIIATSRRRLGAAREVVVEVGPLERSDAAALFEARARAASPAYRARPLEASEVEALVERIDRLPLAIEILAARMTVLGAADLQRRLSVDLLVQRGGDPRHQSVLALLHAQITDLHERSRADLAQLAWFRGGLSLDDAEALLGPDAVDRLQVLRDSALLQRLPDRNGHARFGTWQLVRELVERDADPAQIQRFCEHLARFGAQPDAIWRLGPEALDDLASSLGDLVRATELALGLGLTEIAVQCALPALHVLFVRGPFADGVSLVERALQAGPTPASRARLQLMRAYLLRSSGQLDAALEAFGETARTASSVDDLGLAAKALTTMGTVELYHGRPSARQTLVEGCRLWERVLDPGGWDAMCEARLRWCDGENERARAAAALALAAAQKRGDRQLVMVACTLLVYEAATDGRLTEAREANNIELSAAHFAYERAIALGHQMDLATAASDLGALQSSCAAYEEAIRSLVGWSLGAPLLRAKIVSAILREDLDEAEAVLREAFVRDDALGGTWERSNLESFEIEIARRRKDPEAAYRAALRLERDFGAIELQSSEIALSERGIALLLLGDLAASRELLSQAPPCRERASQLLRIAWGALLAACDGDRAELGRQTEALRAELLRIGSAISGDDAAIFAAVLGPWAPEQIAELLRR